jgi:hypothetical protein
VKTIAAPLNRDIAPIVRNTAREKSRAGATYREIATALGLSVSIAYAMSKTAQCCKALRRTKRRTCTPKKHSNLGEAGSWYPSTREELAEARHFCPEYFQFEDGR